MKNLGRATPAYLLRSHIQAENELMWEKLTLLLTLIISNWVTVLKQKPYEALLINHIIILAPTLP
jgi:uncharacterized membrane protein YkgB